MLANDILAKFDKINIWTRGPERAPHKPLLVLYALARWSRKEPAQISFRELEPKLTELLKEFGPSRKSYHSEYPFWRLQHDGVWKVDAPKQIQPRKGHTDAKKTELLKYDVQAGFTKEVLNQLNKDPNLAVEIASRILDSHFPESLHSDILNAVGLSLYRTTTTRSKRDPNFRPRVLTTYEYRCAVCSYDVRLGSNLLGIDAAHIRWHESGGPDIEQNGLALCTMHHKIFDKGAFTVSVDGRVLVSDEVNGSTGLEEMLLRFHATTIRKPQRPEHEPGAEFLKWHKHEVFKGQPRHLP
jgi:putative restriction endonuclease